MALRRRGRARGHGDDAVPSDDPRAYGRSDHRGHAAARARYLLNSEGDRFLKSYAPNAMELACARRHLRAPSRPEIDQGRGVDGNVMLDMRHLGAEKILERLHGTRELAMTFAGVDPIYEPIPVRPGAHYHMGGVDTDIWGTTALEGLYAAGECACVSVHGANRLGGNALMETITYGKRAGAARPTGRSRTRPWRCRQSVEADSERELKSYSTAATASGPGRSATSWPRRCTRTSASSGARSRCAGRARSSPTSASATSASIVEDKGDIFNNDLTQALELGFLLDLAACMVVSRDRAQRESRRTRAPVRLPGPRRRELPQAHDRDDGATTRPGSSGSPSR